MNSIKIRHGMELRRSRKVFEVAEILVPECLMLLQKLDLAVGLPHLFDGFRFADVFLLVSIFPNYDSTIPWIVCSFVDFVLTH